MDAILDKSTYTCILTTNDSLKKIGLKADNLNSFLITQKKQLITYYGHVQIKGARTFR